MKEFRGRYKNGTFWTLKRVLFVVLYSIVVVEENVVVSEQVPFGGVFDGISAAVKKHTNWISSIGSPQASSQPQPQSTPSIMPSVLTSDGWSCCRHCQAGSGSDPYQAPDYKIIPVKAGMGPCCPRCDWPPTASQLGPIMGYYFRKHDIQDTRQEQAHIYQAFDKEGDGESSFLEVGDSDDDDELSTSDRYTMAPNAPPCCDVCKPFQDELLNVQTAISHSPNYFDLSNPAAKPPSPHSTCCYLCN